MLNEFEALRPVLWLPLNSIHLFSLYSNALSGKSTLFRHRFWEHSPSTRAPCTLNCTRGPPCTLKSSLNGTLKDTLRACPGVLQCTLFWFPEVVSLRYRETMIGATSSTPRPCIPVKTRFLQLKNKESEDNIK